jgi:hypothetical protein
MDVIRVDSPLPGRAATRQIVDDTPRKLLDE